MKTIVMTLGGLLITVVGLGLWLQPGAFNAAAREKPLVPTFFVHGYGSSYRAERFMVKTAEKRGAVKGVLRANVDPDGKVTLKGQWRGNAQNPVVMVHFEESRNTNHAETGTWVKNVIDTVQATYPFETFNAVGHSMGNMAWMHYMLQYGREADRPRLNKEVFSGSVVGTKIKAIDEATGKPQPMPDAFADLVPLQKRYAKHHTQVLNIYGTLDDGSASDGRVPNVETKSIRYLTDTDDTTYEEVQIEGEAGQHSQLHEDQNVAELITNFLWDK